MSANRIPIYHDNKNVAAVAISTANTGRDGTGTLGTVMTAGANGSAITRVDVVAPGTTTAGMVRLFLDNGSAKFLIKEIAITAITPSASLPGFADSWTPGGDGLCLPTGWSLKASTHNAESFNVAAHYGNY